MDWNDNKSLAMLCGALIERIIKNKWLKRTFFEIMARLVFMKSDDNNGLGKWYLLQRIMSQISKDKEKISYDNKTNIDLQLLRDSIKDNEFVDSYKTDSEQFKLKIQKLEKDSVQKETEIEGLKKLIQNIQQTAEIKKRREMERLEIVKQRKILEEDSIAIRNILSKFNNNEKYIAILEEIKKVLPHLVQQTVDEQIDKQDKNVDVINKWFEVFSKLNYQKKKYMRT